jgi:leader peptidase (prepilin peptidase)/N-methyltransferase
MEIYLAVLFGLLGVCIGSFLNVAIDRLPSGKSLVMPPSHCDACGRRLSTIDLIPVFSYIALRGRCRTCKVRIPLRILLVELGCGLFLALLFLYKGLTIEFGVIALYSFVFIAIGLIDLRTRLILNKIVYPSLVAALIISPFFLPERFFASPFGGMLNGLTGAGLGFVALLIPVVVTMGRGMGFGDVKMAALIGLTTGLAGVMVAVLGGIILGGLVALILLLTGIKKRKEAIPFGPFLSLATIVTLLWGPAILHWYMGIFGM